MNNGDALQAVVDFVVANHDYVNLIHDAFIKQGRFTRPADFAAAMKHIKEAKANRDLLEVKMYALLEEIHGGHRK